MITKSNFLTLIIIVLGVIIALQQCSSAEKDKELMKVNGKTYEVIKHTTDTVTLTKTTTKNVRGEDIYHETIVEKIKEIDKIIPADTAAILRNFYTKTLYKDRLTLEEGLGTIDVIDTISQNKIIGRKYIADVKQKTITNTTIVKELPKNKVWIGLNGIWGSNLMVGPNISLVTKRDNLYNAGLYVDQDGNRSYGVGMAWKIKLKK
jgi:hypothetical protein